MSTSPNRKRRLNDDVETAASTPGELPRPRAATNTVLMVRPCRFGFNEQTAASNKFQHKLEGDLQSAALAEFDEYVRLLRQQAVNVFVVEDTAEPPTPDSIYPNNWISTDSDGTVCLFPMCSQNRRDERDKLVLQKLREAFVVKTIVDFSPSEDHGEILEGTGSLLLDKVNRVVYAALGPRTHFSALQRFAKRMNFARVVAFEATDESGALIYHTNVMMTLCEDLCIVCLEVIREDKERAVVKEALQDAGKEILEITEAQMRNFCGNCLALEDPRLLVMSKKARESFTEAQIELIQERVGDIVSPDLHVIETVGGGSARCMLAEVFLAQSTPLK